MTDLNSSSRQSLQVFYGKDINDSGQIAPSRRIRQSGYLRNEGSC